MKRDSASKSIWQEMPGYESQKAPELNTIFDVIIVGGGITGVTSAFLLQKAGKKCLLLEARNLAFGTTSGTTAHLNTILDLTYAEIEKKFGEENTKLILASTLEAINLVEENVIQLGIDCDFSRREGYLFSVDEKQTKKLEEAFSCSLKAGCEVEYADSIPLPVGFQKSLVFKDQAQIHPVKYVYGLAKNFEASGGVILQNCRFEGVKENEEQILEVETSLGKMRARNLIYATHIPPGRNLMHFECAPFRSYVIAVSLNGEYPAALAYDLEDPYHYFRTGEVEGEKLLLIGGEDHKTAEEKDTRLCFERLEEYARDHFDVAEVVYQWSSQYFQPADGMPYIGHLPGSPQSVYVATGYGGNGITFSQAAAKILCDLIVKNESPYRKVFDPARIKPIAGFEELIKNSATVTAHLVKKLFPEEKIKELSHIKNGQAKVVAFEDQSLGIYKNEEGTVFAVDPTCPHMGCKVAWNQSEKAWECPCHGSRFNEEGEMITGPAKKDLKKIDLKRSSTAAV